MMDRGPIISDEICKTPVESHVESDLDWNDLEFSSASGEFAGRPAARLRRSNIRHSDRADVSPASIGFPAFLERSTDAQHHIAVHDKTLRRVFGHQVAANLNLEPEIADDRLDRVRNRRSSAHRLIEAASPTRTTPVGLQGSRSTPRSVAAGRYRGEADRSPARTRRSLADHGIGAAAPVRHEPDQALKRLYRIAQDERLRLARALHDNTSPYIASLVLGLRRLERFVVSPQGHEQIASLRSHLDRMSTELRWVMFELRPAGLGDFGLTVALRSLAETWSKTSNLVIDVAVSGTEARYESQVEVTLFHFCQEALANVAKHAHGATRVDLDIHYGRTAIAITVKDDGSGCPAERMTTERLLSANKMGIVGMRERLDLVGGHLRVDGAPGRGTTLVARVPCEGTTA